MTPFIRHAEKQLEAGAVIEHDERANTYTIVNGRLRIPLTRHKYEKLCEETGRDPIPVAAKAAEPPALPPGDAAAPVAQSSESTEQSASVRRNVEYTDALVDTVGDLREAGKSYSDIADELGIVYHQVVYLVARHKSGKRYNDGSSTRPPREPDPPDPEPPAEAATPDVADQADTAEEADERDPAEAEAPPAPTNGTPRPAVAAAAVHLNGAPELRQTVRFPLPRDRSVGLWFPPDMTQREWRYIYTVLESYIELVGD